MGALLQARGEDLYRMKGILAIKGLPDRYVFQVNFTPSGLAAAASAVVCVLAAADARAGPVVRDSAFPTLRLSRAHHPNQSSPTTAPY